MLKYNNVTGITLGASSAVTCVGTVTGSDFILSSDARLKTNLRPLADALASLDGLNGYRYWHTRHQRDEVGLIAQEVRTVLPEAVFEGADGMLGVSYERVVPLLLVAVKQLKARVVELEAAR